MGIRHICLWVTVVRHAETELTRAHPRVLQGQTDYPLNENGVRQAEALAWRLAKETFAHIISSDLARAKGTTEAIAKYHPEVPVTYDRRLREKDLGDLAGMSWPSAKELLKQEGVSLDDHVSRTGETPKLFEDRVVEAYSDIIERFLLDPNRVEYSESEENLARLANMPLATPVGSEPPRTAGRRESLLATAGDLLAKHLELAGLSTPQRLTSPSSPSPAIGNLKTPRREQQVLASPRGSGEEAAAAAEKEHQQLAQNHNLPVKVTHVLVVTHGGTIQELLGHIVGELGFAVYGPPPTGFPKNSGISRFVISRVNKPDGDYEWEGRLTLYNCVSHLAGFGRRGRGGTKTDKKIRSAISGNISAATPQQRGAGQQFPVGFRIPTISAPPNPHGAQRDSPTAAAGGVRSAPSFSDSAGSPQTEADQVPPRTYSSASSASPKSPRVTRAIMTAGSKLFGGGRKGDRPASPSSPSTKTGFAIMGSAPVPQQAPRVSGSKGKSLGW